MAGKMEINLKNAMKKYSKEKKIKKKDYVLWFSENDLFFTAFPRCSLCRDEQATKFIFRGEFKTLEADNVLWDILKMPENKALPLSLRSTGAFTVYQQPLIEESIVVDDDSEEGLFGLLEQEMNRLFGLSHTVTADNYYRNVLERRDIKSLDTDKVVAYLCTGQKERAGELLDKMEWSRFGVGGEDFRELAKMYLSKVNF